VSVSNVRTYVRNGGRGQLSSEWRYNENDVIMRTGAASAASAVGARRHNENDVTMIIAGRRYGDWRHVATGCIALVCYECGHTCKLGTCAVHKSPVLGSCLGLVGLGLE